MQPHPFTPHPEAPAFCCHKDGDGRTCCQGKGHRWHDKGAVAMQQKVTDRRKAAANVNQQQQQGASPATHFTAQDLAMVRRLVLTLLDDGCNCHNEKHPWELDDDGDRDSEFVTERRIRFVDELQRRLVEAAKAG